MAFIYIKRKKDPVILSEERAQKLKEAWLANPKSADLVDLGEWSGGMNEIVSIEMVRNIPKNKMVDIEAETKEAERIILATPIENRAKFLGEFKLAWFMRSGMLEKEPPEEVLKKAEKIALDFYTKFPNDIRVPPSNFEPLLFAKFGVKKGSVSVSEKLAEKLVVPEPHVKPNDVPF